MHSLSDLKPSSFNTKLAAARISSIGSVIGGPNTWCGPERADVCRVR